MRPRLKFVPFLCMYCIHCNKYKNRTNSYSLIKKKSNIKQTRRARSERSSKETSYIYIYIVQHARYSPLDQNPRRGKHRKPVNIYPEKKPRFSVNPEETRQHNKNGHTLSMQRTPFSIRTHNQHTHVYSRRRYSRDY